MALQQPRPFRRRSTASLLIALATFFWSVFSGSPPPVAAAESAAGRTPPRLSFVDGEVSFWRPGTDHWVPAEINLPLAPGDLLETGAGANLELQIGAGAFVRAGQSTQLGVQNQDTDYLQLKVNGGHVALDVRELQRGYTLEVDTPNAVFTIDVPGYYRVAVGSEATSFTARRNGRATVVPNGGTLSEVATNYEVRIEGAEAPTLSLQAAAAVDDWDRWNYERTDTLLADNGSPYVSEGVYGGGALTGYGTWRDEPTYGPVWVPSGVPAGWAPYTTGRWVWDPYYSWSWVDSAPWGWAPYHYGRWVFTGGCWGWAPGPFVARPFYSPALVAFFGGGGFRVGVGWPFVGWVPLGWGEPLFPWWGGRGFIGKPCWWGWGGPRVNINNTFVVNNFDGLQNAHVHNALVTVPGAQFGRLPVDRVRITGVTPQQVQPIRGALPVHSMGGAPSGAQTMRPPPQGIPAMVGRPPSAAGGHGFPGQLPSAQTPPLQAGATSHGATGTAPAFGSASGQAQHGSPPLQTGAVSRIPNGNAPPVVPGRAAPNGRVMHGSPPPQAGAVPHAPYGSVPPVVPGSVPGAWVTRGSPPPQAGAQQIHNGSAPPAGRAAPSTRIMQGSPPPPMLRAGPSSGVGQAVPSGNVAFASPPARPQPPANADRVSSGQLPQGAAPPVRVMDTRQASNAWPVPHGVPPAAPPRPNVATRQSVPYGSPPPSMQGPARPMVPMGRGAPQMAQPQRPSGAYYGGGQGGHGSAAPMGSGSTRGAAMGYGGVGMGAGGVGMGAAGHMGGGAGRGR